MEASQIPYGKIIDNKVILNAWGDYPEREIGEVRDSEELSVQYFQERFQELEAKVVEIEEAITEAQNKGSFLMKLVHLKGLLEIHDGLGDYQVLYDRIVAQEELLKDIISKNRVRNTEIRKALLEEIEVAAAKVNWKEATEQIHDVKGRWLKTGNAVEEEHDELESQFWGVVDAFFEKKKSFYEDKVRLQGMRKGQYEQLVKRAAQLCDLSPGERYAQVKTLKSEWKEVGGIPKEDYMPLLKSFNYHIKSTPRPVLGVPDITKKVEYQLKSRRGLPFKELEGYRTTLKKNKPSNLAERQELNKAFNALQMLMELDFVSKIASKKNHEFDQMDEKQKDKVRVSVLQELIKRDQADLEQYESNSGIFSTASGSVDLIEKRLRQQQRKIQTKVKLLNYLKGH